MDYGTSTTRALEQAGPSDWSRIPLWQRREALEHDLAHGWTVRELFTAMVAAGWDEDQASRYLLFAGIGAEMTPGVDVLLRSPNALFPIKDEAWLRIRTQHPTYDGGERLVGIAEIAQFLGESRQKVAVWRQREKLPKPHQELAMGPVWHLYDIYAWVAETNVE